MCAQNKVQGSFRSCNCFLELGSLGLPPLRDVVVLEYKHKHKHKSSLKLILGQKKELFISEIFSSSPRRLLAIQNYDPMFFIDLFAYNSYGKLSLQLHDI